LDPTYDIELVFVQKTTAELFVSNICTKSFVCWHFAPDSTGGAYSAPPDFIAVFRGPTSKGRGAERREGEGVRPLP